MYVTPEPSSGTAHRFPEAERAGVYRAIFTRRDVRRQYIDREVSDLLLNRLLTAAHHAPSVGLMQPWNFIVIRSLDVKQQIRAAFETANARAEAMFEPSRRAVYRSLKLEGILEAPINLCITCDRSRHGPVVLGRTSNESMDLYSTVCAVQNLWLAARAEGLGVGWVSILDEPDLRRILNIPDGVVPLAYLCLGYVDHFPDRPELEQAGWLDRLPLENLIFENQWGNRGEHCSLRATQVETAQVETAALQTAATGKQIAAPRIKRLTLVRHASVPDNLEGRYIGSTDVALGPQGLREAERLAAVLSHDSFERVWCTPLQRGRQTAEKIAGGRSVEFLDELREIDFGRWERRTFEAIAREDPQRVNQWAQCSDRFAFPGGESIAEFQTRVERVAARMIAEDASSILVVAHGGVLRHLICHFLGISANRSLAFQMPPASIARLDLHGDQGVLTSLNAIPQETV